MVRRKMKFNSKLFKRFTKKELVGIMKKNKFPAEKALSRYTKAEIVSQLIRLQRNKLYYDVFKNIPIKSPRQLSDKQKTNLAIARGRLNNAALKTKQAFPDSQNVDTKRKVENRLSTTVLAKNPVQQEIIFEAATLVNQQPSRLEQIKQGDSGTLEDLEKINLGNQFSSLEELFVFSDKKFSKQKKRVIDLLINRKRVKGIAVGTSGKQPRADEETKELPTEIKDIISGQIGKVDSEFLIVVNKLNIKELKSVLDEAQIGRRGLQLKAALAQVVAVNKTKTNQLVRNKVKVKLEARNIIKNIIEELPLEVQQGQVVKDNEGAKVQASKRNILPQGSSQSSRDVINKDVGNLDKPKGKKSKKGRRKIVVKK